jgi:hypothetical protein
MDYKVNYISHAQNIVCTNLYIVVYSNGFTQCITHVMGILPSPIVSMEPMNKLPFEQTNIMFNNEHYATLSQPSKQMVVPYL